MPNLTGPLLFAPIYRDYPWGGDRIPKLFGRKLPPGRYAESWEISAHPDGVSIVQEGPFSGISLPDLVARFRSALVGSAGPADRFPLLIKLIDARETLSVQVHPNERTAPLSGGEPKTEMWYVLHAEPGACVYLGFAKGVTRRDVEYAIRDQTLEQILVRHPVRVGQAIYVPGGCVHAIGAGCLMLECQQTSNTTFRLYDWNRIGPDGRPRELHIDAAFRAIDWDQVSDRNLAPLEPPNPHPEFFSCVKSPFFEVCAIYLDRSGRELDGGGKTFHVLFSPSSPLQIESGEGISNIPRGRAVLVPATGGPFRIIPESEDTTFLLIRLPGE